MRIVQAHGQEIALAIKDDGQVARNSLVALPADRLIEQPGMSMPQRPLRLRCDVHGDAPVGGAGNLWQCSQVTRGSRQSGQSPSSTKTMSRLYNSDIASGNENFVPFNSFCPGAI